MVITGESTTEPDLSRGSDDQAVPSPAEDAKKWGYDLYPERRGETYKPKWTKILFGMEGTYRKAMI